MRVWSLSPKRWNLQYDPHTTIPTRKQETFNVRRSLQQARHRTTAFLAAEIAPQALHKRTRRARKGQTSTKHAGLALFHSSAGTHMSLSKPLRRSSPCAVVSCSPLFQTWWAAPLTCQLSSSLFGQNRWTKTYVPVLVHFSLSARLPPSYHIISMEPCHLRSVYVYVQFTLLGSPIPSQKK